MDTLGEHIIWWQLIFKDTELICKNSKLIFIHVKTLLLVHGERMGITGVPKKNKEGIETDLIERKRYIHV